MSLQRKGALLAALTLIAVVGIGVVAGAENIKKYKSHVKITDTSPKFKGKVSSSNRACIQNRKVKLYAVEAGKTVVGTDKTNKKGRWKIEFQGEGAGLVHYFAKVQRTESAGAGTVYVCKRDRTPKVTQEAPMMRGGMAYDTETILKANFPAFHGRVKSESDLCVSGRKVKLYRKVRGHAEANDKKLGVDYTNGKGRWKVKVDPLKSGAYYARTSKAGFASNDTTCKADKSNVAAVD